MSQIEKNYEDHQSEMSKDRIQLKALPHNLSEHLFDEGTVKSAKKDTPIVRASAPWSNTSPSGDDVPVFRACLPSKLSKV
jgi:hypothetical protein